MAYIVAQYLLWLAGMNLSLADDVVKMVTTAGGPKGATRYIEALVREAWRKWLVAFDHLALRGWCGNEIRAACDALEGYFLTGQRPTGAHLALALKDDAIGKWELDDDRWQALIGVLVKDDDTAQALWTVAREFWAGNEVLKQRIKKLGVGTVKPVGV